MATPAVPGGVDPQVYSYIASNFPQMLWALSTPDLAPVITQAATNQWDAGRIQGALEATNWWKTHSQASRDWTQLAANDPAEAAKRVTDQILAVKGEATKLGLDLSEQQLESVADNALYYGQSTQEITQNIMGLANAKTFNTTSPGQIGTGLSDLKKVASDYMVPISDMSLLDWSGKMATGQTDIAAFNAYMQAQAKSLYPSMAASIDQGITPRAYMDPYKQVTATMLGLNPASIDMMEPQYMRAVTQKDPKTGVPTAMSLYDWQQTLMSDPTYGYMKTQGAADRASSLAAGIAQMFGRSPGGGTGFPGVAAPRV